MNKHEIIQALTADDTLTTKSRDEAKTIEAIAAEAGIQIFSTIERTPTDTYVIWAI